MNHDHQVTQRAEREQLERLVEEVRAYKQENLLLKVNMDIMVMVMVNMFIMIIVENMVVNGHRLLPTNTIPGGCRETTEVTVKGAKCADEVPCGEAEERPR